MNFVLLLLVILLLVIAKEPLFNLAWRISFTTKSSSESPTWLRHVTQAGIWQITSANSSY